MMVLVTGATGFVGSVVRDELVARGLGCRSAVRSGGAGEPNELAVVGDIDGVTDWAAALEGVSQIVHLAARVHVMKDTAIDSLAEFRRVNVQGTERLARMAAVRGVRRLVYVSSIKVNGEGTMGCPFSASDPAAPRDPYGLSKWEAEQALARVVAETGLEVVVVRPPLVYGARVRGNFLRLMQLASSGIPLPFGAANNLRSLVFVRNLADALVTCVTHPSAAHRTYLVSDGEDLSTADLSRRLSLSLSRTPRLFPLSHRLLSGVAIVTRRTAELQRLFGSLQVDSAPIGRELGWKAPYTVEQGLAEAAAWFRTR